MKLHPDINYENKEMSKQAVTKRIKSFNSLPQRILDIHKDTYLYHNFIFTGMHDKGQITCPIHGDFPQSMIKHLMGRGCKHCADESRSKLFMKSAEQFIKEATLKHNGKFDYSLVDYKGSFEEIIIICPEHGKFPQTPDNHLNGGQGCPYCAEYGFNPSFPAILYYICIDELYYKIGITNRTTELRYGKGKMKRIRIVKEWKYKIGRDAYNKEQYIIQEFKEHLYDKNLLNEGKKNKEIFNHDILQLDNY